MALMYSSPLFFSIILLLRPSYECPDLASPVDEDSGNDLHCVSQLWP